jgi:hypothetical protein
MITCIAAAHGLKSGIIATLKTPNIDSNVAVWKKRLTTFSSLKGYVNDPMQLYTRSLCVFCKIMSISYYY